MTTEHPYYTADPEQACSATTWGGDHTCQCVYRKTVCDGKDHTLNATQGEFQVEVSIHSEVPINPGSIALVSRRLDGAR